MSLRRDSSSKIVTPVLLALVALAAGGCQCSHDMRTFSVHVRSGLGGGSAGRAEAPVEVNLVGVNDAELSRWSNYSMTQYWSPNDPLRKSADKVVMQFSRKDAARPIQTLKDFDPVWARWKSKGAMHLLVLAYLPEVMDDRPGDRDPRRLILPLDECRWGDLTHLKVVVKPQGVLVATPPKENPKAVPERGGRVTSVPATSDGSP